MRVLPDDISLKFTAFNFANEVINVVGLLGSAFTTPTDIAKVRLQADGFNGQPRKYRGTVDVFRQVYSQQGFRGLYTGATPNVIRAICITSMQVMSCSAQ